MAFINFSDYCIIYPEHADLIFNKQHITNF